jgi:hypothetical protein
VAATAGVGLHAAVTGIQLSRRRKDGSTYLLDAPPEERDGNTPPSH